MQVLRDALADVVDVARQVLPLRDRTLTLEDAAASGRGTRPVRPGCRHPRPDPQPPSQARGAVTQDIAAVEPLVRRYGIVRDVSRSTPGAWSCRASGLATMSA